MIHVSYSYLLFQCGLDTYYWTGFNHFVIWGSIIFYFIFTLIFYCADCAFVYTYAGVATALMQTANFWFTLLLTVVIILIPVLSEQFYQVDTRPTLTDKVRLQQKIGMIKKKAAVRIIRRGSTVRRSQRSVGRSGYAFAHQEGFGELITSGSIMRKVHPFKAKSKETISKGLASSLTGLAMIPNSNGIQSTECQTTTVHSSVHVSAPPPSSAHAREMTLEAARRSSDAGTEEISLELQDSISNRSSDESTVHRRESTELS